MKLAFARAGVLGLRQPVDTWSTVSIYRLHDVTGDDLGFLEHPAPNLEPGDVLVVADGREAVVTARVEAEPGPGPLVAMLEVALAPLGSKSTTHSSSSPPDVPGASDDPARELPAKRGARVSKMGDGLATA